MTSIFLVRHGETTWNTQGRFQGHSDTPLSATGQRQANALSNYLNGESLQAIYSSDLRRAWDTAKIINTPHKLEVKPNPQLREMNFGSWEGLDFREIQDKFPEKLAEWQNNIMTTAPPGGENLEQLVTRVQAAYGDIINNNPEGDILLVAHGGVLQVLLCFVLDLSPLKYWQFRLAPGSLSEIAVYHQGVILNRLNLTFDL
jgi:alpha-ribazole phosphatase/probable phosphoglycerate mutase